MGLALLSMAAPSSKRRFNGGYDFTQPPPDSADEFSVDDDTLPGSDRYGDPVTDPGGSSPFNYRPPSNVDLEIDVSEDLRNYEIKETVGDSIEYRPPAEMDYEQFYEYQRKRYMREYWDQVSKTEKDEERDFEELSFSIPDAKGDPIVEIKPAGNVTLEFGGRWQRTENPAIPIRQQRNGGFEFDQQISMNLQGTIGERVNVNANWDTQATFDFDNNINISYNGKEEDIIRDIQAGNVSMSVDNSLIRGAQNLFGVKTQLQFGRMGVTSVVSNQRGARESITIRGGAQSREFEIQAHEYDVYRHFFVGHFFKDRFNGAFRRNGTNPNSGFTITRMEVFVTNVNTNTENLRNIIAFDQLGEAEPNDPNNVINVEGGPPSNSTNDLYEQLVNTPGFRSTDDAEGVATDLGLELGTDFEKINSARKLEPERDFTFHPELGYISLNSRLQDDQALAVSFEYTYRGENYKVGELAEDYGDFENSDVIITKLLKPQSLRTVQGDEDAPQIWDLMMKNIYSLNTSSVSQDNFQFRVVYRDDRSGVNNPTFQESVGAPPLNNTPILQLLNLDQYNQNNDPAPDGNFDFIPQATILPRNGKVVFPVREPFGSHLADTLMDVGGQAEGPGLVNKYEFPTLYNSTQNEAQQRTQKNKFFLVGSYQSATSADIMLPGVNIAEGSVVVTSGSITLSEGNDYTVDYNLGRVRITNEGVMASGNDITVSYEKSDVMSFRQKTLIGTRLDYRVNKDFNIGATVMHLNERPMNTRVNIGDEPIKNTQVGLDLNLKDESRMITRLVDMLPGIQTKAPSNVNLTVEAAGLIPGSSNILTDGGSSYIDDFQGAETPYDFSRNPTLWRLGSTPRRFEQDWRSDTLQYTYRRAKLAWYTIDRTFYQGAGGGRGGFSVAEYDDDTNPLEVNHYMRAVLPQEVFPQQDQLQPVRLNTNTFDLVYHPEERGPYNFNVDGLDSEGKLTNPKQNWASITRAIQFDTDFNKANIQYIEFWMMDPFVRGQRGLDGALEEIDESVPTQDLGGKLYFNLGNVSEDVMNDGRHAFENGLPDDVVENEWGRVTTQQFITDAFDNTADRESQDKGLDGLTDEEERDYYAEYIDELQNKITDAQVLEEFVEDPSADNFNYFRSGENDDRLIPERYRDFNGMEGNSPLNQGGGQPFPESNYNTPDNEDLNKDNTINSTDDYFEYELEITPQTFSPSAVGTNPYIVDRVEGNNGVDWYQVRIPIRQVQEQFGNITGFQTIKFFRMYLTGFENPQILRMLQFKLVGSQWRASNLNLIEDGTADYHQAPKGLSDFTVSTVNIEENSNNTPNKSPYVLPPGVVRDFDRANQMAGSNQPRLNEQSLQLCVERLDDRNARGAFKNFAIDMVNYNRLRMFIHAETVDPGTRDGDLIAFLRLGTDYTENFYEIRVPLTFSDISSSDAFEVWREENEIDIALKELVETKLERNREGEFSSMYLRKHGKYTLGVKGRPSRNNIRVGMVGVINPAAQNDPDDDGQDKTACIWFNELRVTDFDTRAGYATNASLNTELADLGTLSASGRYITPGYGDIESQISDRERAHTLQYGVASNIELDQFIPDKVPISLPLYVSYDQERVTPQFNPLDPDVEIQDAINNKEGEERENFEEKVIYKKTLRSINLTNVQLRKNPDKESKSRFYDPQNLSLSVGYNEEKSGGLGKSFAGRGNNVASFLLENYTGEIGYNYSGNPKEYTPFKKVGFLKGKYLQLFKDINVTPVPNNITVRGNLRRSYVKTQLYNAQLTTLGVNPTFEKEFTFDRNYAFRWNLTKSINLNYNSTANAIVDEPSGDRQGNPDLAPFDQAYAANRQQYRDSVLNNLMRLGRLKRFNQTIGATYKVPLSKIPLLNWLNTDVSYNAGFNWRAETLGLQDELGNYISNNNSLKVNAKMNMTRLYTKVPFLKKIYMENKRGSSNRRRRPSRGRGDDDEEDDDEEEKREFKGLKKLAGVLMSLDNVTASYTVTHNTDVPGFKPIPTYLGASETNNFAPGYRFLLGDQNLDAFKERAVRNDWYTTSEDINRPITQMRNDNFNARASLEPIKGMRIQVEMNYSQNQNYQEIFRYNEDEDEFRALNPNIGGSMDMSYFMGRTAFMNDRDDNSSEVFDNFKQYRRYYRDKLNAENTQPYGSYGLNTQDVMIPAFIAAYSGKELNSANDISDDDLMPRPKTPLPNWRIDYSGLSRMDKLKDIFSSVNINHAYTSSFSIRNYTSSLEYDNIRSNSKPGDLNVPLDTNGLGQFVPVFVINQVSFSESFSPLIGINLRTKNDLSVRVDWNRSRQITLDPTSSTQINESKSNDLVIGLGYSTNEFTLPFRIQGEKRTLDNTITFRVDFSIRDTKTIQRSLDSDDEEGNNVLTRPGNWNFRLMPNINYEVSRRLNAQLFFERTINEPRTSDSFRRTSTAFGVRLRFSLS